MSWPGLLRSLGSALLFCLPLQAQLPAGAGAVSGLGSGVGPGVSLTFTLDRTGAAATHYTVQLDQATGRGVYRGDAGAAGAGQVGAGQVGAGQVGSGADQPITVGGAALGKIFAAGPLVRSNRCASRRKGIAQTGTKTLRLTEGGAAVECSYNYSDDDRVNEATTVLEAVAETMQYGERLQLKLRFDRLGLDAEMDSLDSALRDGRALEVRNIAAVLQAIENEDRVMERVRRRAAHLLESAGVVAAPATRTGDPPEA